MSASFLLNMIAPISAIFLSEQFVLRKHFPDLYKTSQNALANLPRAYSGVILLNVITSAFVIVTLGFKVSAARTLYQKEAEANGDKDAKERFSLPKLYAEGFSEEAKKFNCVQRGHQQALETYPQFLALSIFGGMSFPVATAIGGLLWNYARLKWADGYASGEPSKRYSHWASRWIWTGLLVEITAATITAVKMAL